MSSHKINIWRFLGKKLLFPINFDKYHYVCSYYPSKSLNLINIYYREDGSYEDIMRYNDVIREIKSIHSISLYEVSNAIKKLIYLNLVPSDMIIKLKDIGPYTGTAKSCHQLTYRNGKLRSINECQVNSRKNSVIINYSDMRRYMKESYLDHPDDRIQFKLSNGDIEDIIFVRITKL